MTFAEIEECYRALKKRYATGELTEADFKARLQDLMIEDEQGRWWIIGYQTGQWYVSDGEHWVVAEPKSSRARRLVASEVIVAPPIACVGGLVLASVFGYGIGRWVYWGLYSNRYTTGETMGPIAGLVVALSGLLVTLALVKRAQLKHRLPLTLVGGALGGWLLCIALACGLGWLVYRAFVNPGDFSGEAWALIAGCVVTICGSLYLALSVRWRQSSREDRRRL